eukprot:g6005.t1
MKKFRKSHSRPFVRAREELHETKLEAANLRENLVHEEFRIDANAVYDFSHGKDAKEVGGFGEVQAVTHRKTGTKYAMKTVKLSGVKSQKAFEFIMKEVDLLKSLDHPNIVRLQEVYMSDSHLYMAMDLITGGNLAGGFRCDGEEQAAAIVRQVVRALRYLHDRNIAHRDLKLENILIESGGGSGTPMVKLVDFGLSAIYHENGVSTDVLGSWNYVAPEVIKGQYRPAPADMWSLGVVSYVLMSRTLPFNADSTEGIQRNILSAKYVFRGKAWAGASESARHFVRSLLLKSPDLRLTAEGAQKHDWLRGAEDLSQTPQKCAYFRADVTQSLLDFRDANPMKQLALEVVARTLDPAQISLLAEEFDRADNNNNGEVSLSEFKRWLEANDAARGMAEEDVEALFNSVDVDNSGFIHYNEFLAATIQQRKLDEAHLRPAFDRLDRSHTGFINLDDVTLTTGAKADMKESAEILAHFDMNGDGRISFEEFVNGMRRMGGSTREKGGLLSATGPPFPSGRSEHSTEEHGQNGEQGDGRNAAGKKDERGERNAPPAATDAPAIDQEISRGPPSEHVSLQLRSPADDAGRGNRDVEAFGNGHHTAPTPDDPEVSRDDGSGAGTAATETRVSAQEVVEGLHKRSTVVNGNGVAMSRLEGDGARLEGQGCAHEKGAKEVGGFGEVQAVTHRTTGTKYAMKTVKLSGVKSQEAFEFIMKEVDLLKSLDHPNIVRLQEVYMSDSHLYMAMDLITGGNLAGGFRCDGEEQAAAIVSQIVRALRYLHDRHIAHRDLKLDNILIESGGKDDGSGAPVVKLVDFGLSAIYEENGVSTDVLGSWHYVAPEVLMGHYHPAPADMWSLGVVSYALMSRTFPFDADSTVGIQQNILSAKFGFKGEAWARASESARHFVRSLLLKSPHLRLTAEGAQNHRWPRKVEGVSHASQKSADFRRDVTQSLLDFRDANPMKQLALEVVARTLDPAQISLLAEEFDHADKNHNGEVSLSEFKGWLEANGAARSMGEEEVDALFNSVDYDHCGFIHYNEFLAATIQQRKLDEAHLRPAFDRLDRSHTGFINLDDVTLTTGAKADMKESAEILAHFDMNGDGRISFEEFVNGMRRMGGSTREKGGLLSASPVVTGPPFPSERSGHSTEEHGQNGEQGGGGIATHVRTGATTIDREGTHRPSDPEALQFQSPLGDVGRVHSFVKVPDNDPQSAPVEDESQISEDDGGEGGADAASWSRQSLEEGCGDRAIAPSFAGYRTSSEQAAARLSAQVAGVGSRNQSLVGKGHKVTMSVRDEGGARLEGQRCGCVMAAQSFDGVRYVSPVTARLFSKAGHSEVLGLSAGEVLAPIEANWRDTRQQSGQAPSLEAAAAEGEEEEEEEEEDEEEKEDQEAAPPPPTMAGGLAMQQRQVEVVRPSAASPVPSVEGMTSPQAYLELILFERGYDYTPRSSASDGCRCAPTQKQIDDYQVPLVEAVRRWDMETLEALAAEGVDMGASNRFGESVVHLATRRGSAPVLQFLLAHGGSLRICDDYGKTPLHDAFWTAEPRFDLVSMMLEIDWGLLRATDVRGATPLRYAKRGHWAGWCEFLDRIKDHLWPHLPPGQRAGDGGDVRGDRGY